VALLIAVVLAAAGLAGGCYSPDVPSCTVTCTGADSCVDGQTCRAGFCVEHGAPACNANMTTDGPAGGPTTSVMIQIAGHGHVVFGATIVCDSETVDLLGSGTCSVTVPQHVPVHATAIGANGAMFMTWTGACTGGMPACDFTPVGSALSLSPHFK
jgi:hypothetical protein